MILQYSKYFLAGNEEYDLPDDVYDTKGLFDDGQEGKQDNEGLLYWPSSLMKTDDETLISLIQPNYVLNYILIYLNIDLHIIWPYNIICIIYSIQNNYLWLLKINM